MSQAVQMTDIQFTGNGEDAEKLRRLVEELQKTQQQLNALVQENALLTARIAALEAGP